MPYIVDSEVSDNFKELEKKEGYHFTCHTGMVFGYTHFENPYGLVTMYVKYHTYHDQEIEPFEEVIEMVMRNGGID